MATITSPSASPSTYKSLELRQKSCSLRLSIALGIAGAAMIILGAVLFALGYYEVLSGMALIAGYVYLGVGGCVLIFSCGAFHWLIGGNQQSTTPVEPLLPARQTRQASVRGSRRASSVHPNTTEPAEAPRSGPEPKLVAVVEALQQQQLPGEPATGLHGLSHQERWLALQKRLRVSVSKYKKEEFKYYY